MVALTHVSIAAVPFLCGIDLLATNWANVGIQHTDHNSNSRYINITDLCLSHPDDEFGISSATDMAVGLKIITGAEKNFAYRECMSLFWLEWAHRAAEGIDVPTFEQQVKFSNSNSNSTGYPFPRAILLDNRHPTAGTPVCLTEHVRGAPLTWHAASLRSPHDFFALLDSLLDILAKLSAAGVVHGSISLNHLVFTGASSAGRSDLSGFPENSKNSKSLSSMRNPTESPGVSSDVKQGLGRSQIALVDFSSAWAPAFPPPPLNPSSSRDGSGKERREVLPSALAVINSGEGDGDDDKDVTKEDCYSRSSGDVCAVGVAVLHLVRDFLSVESSWALPLVHRMLRFQSHEQQNQSDARARSGTGVASGIEDLRHLLQQLWEQSGFSTRNAMSETATLINGELVSDSTASPGSDPATTPVSGGEGAESGLQRTAPCAQPNLYAGQVRVERVMTQSGWPQSTLQGYQSFSITNEYPNSISLLPISSGLQIKSNILDPIFEKVMRGLTLMDVGGNYGYFCFSAIRHGAQRAILVDMDEQYTEQARSISQHLGEPFTSKLQIETRKLQDVHEKVDVVLALALIHWIYSCSEGSSSLALALGKLTTKARKALIVEWVDPLDPVIINHRHTKSKHVELFPDSRGAEDVFDSNTVQAMHRRRRDWSCDLSGNANDINGTAYDLLPDLSSPYLFKEFMMVLQRQWRHVFYLGEASPTRHIFIGVRDLGDFSMLHTDELLSPASSSGSKFQAWDQWLLSGPGRQFSRQYSTYTIEQLVS